MTSSRLPPTIGSADQAGNSWLLGEAIAIDEVTTRVLLRYRALTLAKDHLAALPTTPAGTKALPLADITGGKDWTDTPALKSRLAGGFCLRARPRPLSLRQHLRTLPELPHRRHLPAHPRRPTHRRPQTRRRRPTPRLDHRSRTPPPTHRPPRRHHHRHPEISRITRNPHQRNKISTD
ncbi:Putative transposase [Nocardia cyriacigeorgica GUH-2]|uniref:Putative transposase n=1 Tax=Nocardia cyriacigeorgica (strain GUH-2) TaxID=1127134 RepID=H6R9E0_NOCCG|nr:Putative transposase [Nocardia cyriacigeorgica GUH-2]